MNDELIEQVARAIHAAHMIENGPLAEWTWEEAAKSYYEGFALAAIAAMQPHIAAEREDAARRALDQKRQFQSEVADWMLVCFGPEIAADRLERADRFIEEALELCQTWPAFTADRAHALVDYVFNRPVGEPVQEVGGVMVTLAALCNAAGINIQDAQETELARIWTKVEAIRAKQASKPAGSALPIDPAQFREAGNG